MNVTPTEVAIGVGGLLALVVVWRSGARRARRAAETARASARVVSLAGRVLLVAAGMVGVQWLVVTHTADLTLRLGVLALPDLVAAYVLTRALTVTELGTTRRRR
ncbi:hypothetical protein [Amycolatopsis pithecellobii]|uniref:Uncharacterized protein n=1 Tax=Amycolatopsis pithecellobii TaxID=664692 RepID=A0A6N7Z4F0_9PSEU|nr:hypothetical protein [Amycolatopsis pithecellobii]MTD54076.1 hypothetical protein [Amycolatopsis pithecellobii]